MSRHPHILVKACVVAVLLFSSVPLVLAATYNPCKTPPVVSTGGTKPNVMLVQDYSGSMQWGAHSGGNNNNSYTGRSPCSTYDFANNQVFNQQYLRLRTYYGVFETDTYYVYNSDAGKHYWEAASTQPVDTHTIASTADGGAGTIEITTQTAHSLAVGDVVAINGLTVHTYLNGQASAVLSVSGTKFTVAGVWKGKADAVDTGTAKKRINGTVATGVSGNILNWATASRADVALKALVGGRSDECTLSGCYLRGQSDRTEINDTGLNNTFYRRPATLTDSGDTDSNSDGVADDSGTVRTRPEDWNTGHYRYKTTFLTIMNHQTGKIDTTDPKYAKRYYELWSITINQATGVRLVISGSLTGGSGTAKYVVGLHNAPPSTSYCSGTDATMTGVTQPTRSTTGASEALYYWDLSATTYPATFYVRVTHDGSVTGYTCTNPSPKVSNGTYTLKANVPITKYQGYTDADAPYNAAHNGTTLTGIGEIAHGRIKVKTTLDKRVGVIQTTFNQVRYGLTMFKGDATANKGRILVGCENTDVNVMVNAFQGKTTSGAPAPYNSNNPVDYSQVFFYSGTPTGPGLCETMDYFKQYNASSYATNTAFIQRGTLKDPYYETDMLGNVSPLPCRKSYAVVISDGVWNDGASPCLDPAGVARTMHTTDLRPSSGETTSFPGTQSVTVYAMYTFGEDSGTSNRGDWAMKAVAAFGGFLDNASTDCKVGYPYPYTSVPDSQDTSWPKSLCCDPNVPSANCPSGSTYDPDGKTPCCQNEWNKKWDRDGDGSNSYKGVPDNYFAVSSGDDLAKALTAILQDIQSRNASAGAVATVSQQTQGGDIILRGAFDALPSGGTVTTTAQATYLWYGHLDSYWPFEVNLGEFQYDFQQNCNTASDGSPLLCYQIPSEGCGGNPHCIDFTQCLNKDRESLACYTAPTDRKVLTGRTNKDGRVAYYSFADGSKSNPFVELSTTNLYSTTTLPDGSKRSGCATAAATIGSYLREQLALGKPTGMGNQAADFDNSGTTDTVNCGASCGDCSSYPDYEHLLNWVRGEEFATKPLFRNRTDSKNRVWRVGDIVYSTPVIVGIPTLGAVAPKDPDVASYWTYRNTVVKSMIDPTSIPSSPTINQVIKRVTYVGSNDGMLHAFVQAVWDWENQKWAEKSDASGNDPDNTIPVSNPINKVNVGSKYAKFIGKELWAYVPSTMLGSLQALACNSYATDCSHRTMVDLSPEPAVVRVFDEWRVIITGGMRGGGDVHFAVDVTNPDDPILLWEFSHMKNLVKWTGTSATDFKCALPSEIGYYDSDLKIWPMTWSKPSVGRVNVPSNFQFFYGNPPGSTTTISATNTSVFPFSGRRHLLFAGGGFRMFSTSLQFVDSTAVSTDFLRLLRQPRFVAVDVATGVDLFRYIWPWMYQKVSPGGSGGLFPKRCWPRTCTSATAELPYAMADPTVLDVLDGEVPGTDGLVDHIYVGDLGGNFYGMKFNFSEDSTVTRGLWIDVRLARTVDETSGVTTYSAFRGKPQPITVAPSASLDRNETDHIRVIVGAGKYDDLFDGVSDDKTDPATTSLYNMKEKIELKTIPSSPSGTYTWGGQAPGGMYTYLSSQCGDPSDSGRLSYFRSQSSNRCKWVKNITTNSNGQITGYDPDCCQSSCSSSPTCWKCVFDLTGQRNVGGTGGERVINRGLIAGGLYFTTTYIPPQDACTPLGESNLYIFDYMCEPILSENNPVQTTGVTSIAVDTTNPDATAGFVVDLTATTGTGLSSSPVLDSSGENVIVQMSNASLLKIPVKLPNKPLQTKGWRER
ncbi:MAG: hypothetical protein AB1646_12840 [Thermodesulfobacteriota bacterium]